MDADLVVKLCQQSVGAGVGEREREWEISLKCNRHACVLRTHVQTCRISVIIEVHYDSVDFILDGVKDSEEQ